MKQSCRIAVIAFILTAAASPAAARDLVLTAPPRESAEKAAEIFLPLAEYLTQALGRKVVYRFSDSWHTYQIGMHKDAYDIVFDEPHFVSYRMARHRHLPVVKAPGEFIFAVAVHRDDDRIRDLKDIAGQALCASIPPSLVALSVLAQFDNPARQPRFVDTREPPRAYEELRNKKCAAVAMQAKIFEKLDNGHKIAKVLFQSEPLPNQAISASPRLSDIERARLAEALLSDAGQKATKKLREEYNVQEFVPAKAEEYEPHHTLLKDLWGFQVAVR